MTDILAGIACFTVILVLFRLLERFGADNQQAVAFNYLSAGALSIILAPQPFPLQHVLHAPWLPYGVGVGILFVLVFTWLAKAAQKVGMAIATVANKMSVVIPVVAAFFLFDETVTMLKISGVVVALLGVYLASMRGFQLSFDPAYLWIILLIFFGQGLADVLFNTATQFYVDQAGLGLFFCVIFASAGTIGLLVIGYRIIRRKTSFSPKSAGWGLVIGIPNFLTLFFFFRSLDNGMLESSQVYPIFNIGVVILSALAGRILFAEKLTFMNWTGIVLSALAILAIGFG